MLGSAGFSVHMSNSLPYPDSTYLLTNGVILMLLINARLFAPCI